MERRAFSTKWQQAVELSVINQNALLAGDWRLMTGDLLLKRRSQ